MANQFVSEIFEAVKVEITKVFPTSKLRVIHDETGFVVYIYDSRGNTWDAKAAFAFMIRNEDVTAFKLKITDGTDIQPSEFAKALFLDGAAMAAVFKEFRAQSASVGALAGGGK